MRRWKLFWIVIVAGSAILGVRCGEESASGPDGSGPDEIKVELEHFTESHDVPASEVIRYRSCSSASGQRAVEGMDESGEWIEVPFEVSVSGRYRAYVSYSTNQGDVISVTVSVGDCVSPNEEATFRLAEGTGIT